MMRGSVKWLLVLHPEIDGTNHNRAQSLSATCIYLMQGNARTRSSARDFIREYYASFLNSILTSPVGSLSACKTRCKMHNVPLRYEKITIFIDVPIMSSKAPS